MSDYDDDKTQSHVILTNGTMVQHYRIESKIGAGGMGEVYLAEDTKLHRKVALKFLPANLVENEEIKERFQREAQAVAKLNHPNIVTIHEVSEFKGRPFFVMEHIKGNSLHNFAQNKQLPIDTIVDYAIQICQGLGDAHRNGITHRDIKAANIAIDSSDRIRLLDFGLAATKGDTKLTKTGSTLGTVAYMSPEQISGREIDHRSDLFSLGIVLYELIAGRTPFRKDNEGATLKAIIEDIPEPIARYKANVPEKLQLILDKLLEKDKELRYQSAEGVIADLKRLMYDSQQPQAWQTASGSSPAKSNKLLPVTISAIIIIVIGIWAVFFRGGNEQIVEVKLPVLIVLPFENLGSNEDEYFADGIRTEIGSKLSHIKELQVIGERSADSYKKTKKSIQEIGEEIGADYVLEATIRWDKSGDVDLIRITPRLTKVSNNYLMWSDIYQENLVRIFDVQSKIAEQIVNALGLTLVRTDESAPDYAPTTNMLAYNYYLRGVEVSSHNFHMDDYTESLEMLDSALILDPDFALAWAKKSINHSEFNFFFTTVDADHHQEEAKKAAEKAMEFDPKHPMSKVAMGTYYNLIERDYDKALEFYYSARSEIASDAELSQAIGIVYMRQGKWQEAIEQMEEAVRIDPLTTKRYFFLSNAFSMTRDYESAQNYLNRALVLDPTNTDAAAFKVFNNLLQYGDIEHDEWTFDRITGKAGLANISTYELGSTTSLGFWRFIFDRIDPTEAIAQIREITHTLSPHIVYMNIAQLYDLAGKKDSALIYYDSTRIQLGDLIEQGIYEFHAFSELGVAYAYLGMADSAIYAGKKGMEIMAINDCHW